VSRLERQQVASVWFPSNPLSGAAVAANIAGAECAPGLLVDFDAEWADAASVILDDVAPLVAPGDDLVGSARAGAGGVRVVSARLEPEIVSQLRESGGGVASLPASLTASAVAAEADFVILGVARSFPSLRRARLAVDALPAAHGELLLVLMDGGPSDLSARDVSRTLDREVDLALPPGGREMAASLERGEIVVRRAGAWAKGVEAIASRVWPPARPDKPAGRWAVKGSGPIRLPWMAGRARRREIRSLEVGVLRGSE
jgi:hypothetical protein